jgi:hypothetical protein
MNPSLDTWVAAISSLGGLRPSREEEQGLVGGRGELAGELTPPPAAPPASCEAVPCSPDYSRGVLPAIPTSSSWPGHTIPPRLSPNGAPSMAPWNSISTHHGKSVPLGHPCPRRTGTSCTTWRPFVWDAGGDFLIFRRNGADRPPRPCRPALGRRVIYYQRLVAKYNSRQVLRGTSYAEARRAFALPCGRCCPTPRDCVDPSLARQALAGSMVDAPKPRRPHAASPSSGCSNLSLCRPPSPLMPRLEWNLVPPDRRGQPTPLRLRIGLWPARRSSADSKCNRSGPTRITALHGPYPQLERSTPDRGAA